MSNISDAVARPIRTAAQGGTGWLIVEFIDAFFYDLTDRQYGIAVALATVLLSWIQNLLEDKAGTALLRDIPAREVDVVEKDERGVLNAPTAWVILGIIGLIVIVWLVLGALSDGRA
jgi:hypothetical protein